MKTYYYIMSQTFYFLGDLASRPLNWDWANKEALSGTAEWIAHVNYSVYNWLMLKSVYFNDKGGLDIWSTNHENDEKDENNL